MSIYKLLTATFIVLMMGVDTTVHARFVTSDPIGLDSGLNTYGYVGGNPLTRIDPLGWKTTIITVRDYGIGTHSAVHVDNGNWGQPFLYDPAGSYIPNSKIPRGSGDAFEGPDANLQDFIKYHESVGSTVETTVIDTSPQQEREISRRADEFGGAAPFACTSAVSSALGGVCGIKSPRINLPGSLQDNAEKASCPNNNGK